MWSDGRVDDSLKPVSGTVSRWRNRGKQDRRVISIKEAKRPRVCWNLLSQKQVWADLTKVADIIDIIVKRFIPIAAAYHIAVRDVTTIITINPINANVDYIAVISRPNTYTFFLLSTASSRVGRVPRHITVLMLFLKDTFEFPDVVY